MMNARVAAGRAGGGSRWTRTLDDDLLNRKTDARTLRRVAASFRPYKWQVTVVLGAILLTATLGLVNPILLKLIIDDAFTHRNFGHLTFYVVLMIVTPLVSGLIGVGQTYLNNIVGQQVMRDLRNKLYDHLQRMALRFFTDTRTGEIQSRLTNDVGGVQSVVTNTASSIVSNITTVLSTVVAMLIISWPLTLLSLGLVPLFVWLTYRVGNVRRGLSKDTQKSLADLTAMMEETLSVSGVLLTKTFGRQKRESGALCRGEPEADRSGGAPADGGPLVYDVYRHVLFDFASAGLLAGGLYYLWRRRAEQRPAAHDYDWRYCRLHDAAKPPLLPDWAVVECAGGYSRRAGAV